MKLLLINYLETLEFGFLDIYDLLLSLKLGKYRDLVISDVFDIINNKHR
jgi:hypothetical protein